MTDPARLLLAVLDSIVGHRPLVARERALGAGCGPVGQALASFASSMAQDWEQAAELAESAIAGAEGPTALWAGRAAAAHAAAGWPVRRPADWLDRLAEAEPLLEELDDVPAPFAAYAGWLLVEAGLAQGRLGLASRIAERVGTPPPQLTGENGRPHPWSVVMSCTWVRLLAFRGDTESGRRALPEPGSAGTVSTRLLVAATECLLRGSAAELVVVRRIAAELDQLHPAPADHLASGIHLLAGYGLASVGELEEAARFAFKAGCTPDLGALAIVDRALCLELVTATAIAHGDSGAAEAWAQMALPLLESPIADSTVHRILARVHLLEGRLVEATHHAERAIALAEAAERVMEVEEGRVVLARVRLAGSLTGARDSTVRPVVVRADEVGHLAARRSRARTLHPSRTPPAFPGRGWSTLSPEERQVAELLATGSSNAQVARGLSLSPPVARERIAGVLATFRVATRNAMAEQVAAGVRREQLPPLRRLTPQQFRVAELIATGARNTEIAATLGINQSTVEKHVTAILRRWHLASRAAVADALLRPQSDARRAQ
ncbi:helix-turn-helix transcriptional regulator [Nocardioides jensenii]|uniref:helix-turn-helix transcriptional regulator n=1 Tax=Nocardioides jensenii TaxID=1843 RepID=UPI00082A7BA8|nr:helix-turn-helix transcriptional regulator [Nocardioides jensenii]